MIDRWFFFYIKRKLNFVRTNSCLKNYFNKILNNKQKLNV